MATVLGVKQTHLYSLECLRIEGKQRKKEEKRVGKRKRERECV